MQGSDLTRASPHARRLGHLLALPYTEMDSVFHGSGRTPNPAFVETVDANRSGARGAVGVVHTSGRRGACSFPADLAHPRLPVVQLRSPREVERWVRGPLAAVL